MAKVNYVGQIFGSRLVIKNECTDHDWFAIGAKPHTTDHRYVLCKCLNCGALIPSQINVIRRFPPKRCAQCSNIGNRHGVETIRNTWTLDGNTAICNTLFKNSIISFYIDSDRYSEVSSFIWRISQKRNKFYVVSGSYKKGTQIYLHNLILGEPKVGYEIDHIDGNSLNNRKQNLRFVTHKENVDNITKTRIDNQIGIRGVCYDKKSHMFCVDFVFHGQRFYIKPWKKIEEAVYCRKRLEQLFGLHIIEKNPLAKQYDSLNQKTKSQINEYIKNKVLGNERY